MEAVDAADERSDLGVEAFNAAIREAPVDRPSVGVAFDDPLGSAGGIGG